MGMGLFLLLGKFHYMTVFIFSITSQFLEAPMPWFNICLYKLYEAIILDKRFLS